ncbi:hypothetical protein [Paraburkholderia sp. BR13444]|uniref:hypothetical protein n=1 Tax=Paraburkholderia sp. BR13444 TaxID=3236997 RepID=UPI0034CF38B2
MSDGRIATPVIAWLDTPARERLQELCSGMNAVPERLAGDLLTRALHEYTRGQQRAQSLREEQAERITEAEMAKGPQRKVVVRSQKEWANGKRR